MTDKIDRLRKLMAAKGVDAYLQSVHDEWLGEYPPPCNRRLEWLTGFSGSAGMVVVLADKAALFVDGRYTLQAGTQVGKEYEIFNSGDLSPQEWLVQQLKEGAKIGYDPKLYTRPMLDKFSAFKIVATDNLIDRLWENRPKAPATKIFAHDIIYSGESSRDKRERIAKEIKKLGADAAFLATPESVCWLLNIRAGDSENTPVCLAFAIIDKQGKVQLFVDSSRFDNGLAAHLGPDIKICAQDNIQIELRTFSQKKMLCDQQSTTVYIVNLCNDANIKLLDAKDPCVLPKAIKNTVEITGMKNAHIRDGAAVVKLLCWLDEQSSVTELDVVDKLLSFRSRNDLFVEPSFATIAGSGPNGAIVHYRADKESNRTLNKGELFLLDSGGQYYDGTTDITRTVAIGLPSSEHKDRFTRVLKGHIALATARFPHGTHGYQIDALARQYLWQDGLDYDHGTGHGVGCFSGVHEGPQGISKRAGGAALAAGMVVSNEPGYYKAGEYGIRIENLVTVVEKSTGENGRRFLGFETITCAPIDIALINVEMLTDVEKQWLNNYHEWVKVELFPYLDEDERKWLKSAIRYL